MYIETVCPGCDRKLRVGSDFAGQQARCPVCNAIYQIPGAASEVLADAGPQESPTWRMRSVEGRLYGPVTKTDLDHWVSEGRVTPDCTVMDEDQGSWRPAAEVYPVLASAVPLPESQQSGNTATRYRYLEPHRGGLVLSLGIVSWIVWCPAFGLAAWMMGAADLRDMRAGRMDPRGRAAVQAGQLLGMVNALIGLTILVLSLGILLARVAGF